VTGTAGRLDIERILRTLRAHDVTFIVIGGIAAIAQGAPTITTDIDITARRTEPHDLEALAAALRALDARLRTTNDPDGVPVAIDAAMLATAESWTMTTPHGDLDIVFAPAGTQGYADGPFGRRSRTRWDRGRGRGPRRHRADEASEWAGEGSGCASSPSPDPRAEQRTEPLTKPRSR
jgi:hypothetical protein